MTDITTDEQTDGLLNQDDLTFSAGDRVRIKSDADYPETEDGRGMSPEQWASIQGAEGAVVEDDGRAVGFASFLLNVPEGTELLIVALDSSPEWLVEVGGCVPMTSAEVERI